MAGYILSAQETLFGSREAVGFGDASFHVSVIARDVANETIRTRHYSGKYVNNSYVHLGVFVDGVMMGVLQFGYAMNPASGDSVVIGTPNDGYLELNRMWMDDAAPRFSESRAIAHAIRYIRRAYPTVRWIQSFADERCGLNGKVYQASNFGFYGEHVSVFWEVDGEFFHNIVATTETSRAGTRALQRFKAGRDRAIRHEFRQFRYLYFMQPRFEKGCVFKRLPYPAVGKFAGRPDDAPETIGCESGETPEARSITETGVP